MMPMSLLGPRLLMALALAAVACVACAPSERRDAAPSASQAAAAPPLPAPSASAASATGPLDSAGPELAMLGIAGGPDAPGGGRLGSRFVKKIVIIDCGRPVVVGRLLPELATSIAEKKQVELHRCYRERLTREPTVAGKLSMALTIDAAGKVSEATASGSLTDSTVLACVNSLYSALTFPTSAGQPLRVTYPLEFALGTTVAGKSILGIGEEDLRAALASAQCTDITSRGPAYPNGPGVLTARLSGRRVAVAFVLVTGTRLPDATLAKLADRGALYHESEPFVVAVAVEGDGDKSKAGALLAAIVHDPK
jgi:hypothetical protein